MPKDIVHARIDRKRKIPATSLSLLRSVSMPEEILATFYEPRVTYEP